MCFGPSPPPVRSDLTREMWDGIRKQVAGANPDSARFSGILKENHIDKMCAYCRRDQGKNENSCPGCGAASYIPKSEVISRRLGFRVSD